MGDRIVDSPSTVIAPNLTEEKFHVRRFRDREDLTSMVLGMANQLVFEKCKQSYSIMDHPRYRLKCQVCEKEESTYMCLERCNEDCKIYHICKNCSNTEGIRTCTQNGKSLYEL